MSEIPPVDRIYTDRKADNKSKKNPYLKEDIQNKTPEMNKDNLGDRKEEGKGDIVDIEI